MADANRGHGFTLYAGLLRRGDGPPFSHYLREAGIAGAERRAAASTAAAEGLANQVLKDDSVAQEPGRRENRGREFPGAVPAGAGGAALSGAEVVGAPELIDDPAATRTEATPPDLEGLDPDAAAGAAEFPGMY
jgi:hypothetical protein